MKLAHKLPEWQKLAQDWMTANMGLPPAIVVNGSDAWIIANRCGILTDAYSDRSIYDAHIQTVLEKIFPNASFRDAKRY